ncbi:protein of unknown function [Saccharopolyspora kobensis]|uniref:DUF4190 domain-containing protein n=1 Tax=Saccharopolyspora kobensis TaxID=146035 RepID=A0A1H6E5W4_9PSEU|nr:DUF4190 domain-containing protein [Saccharopolyspora kobensis]SEG93027.1 protein of unknown function [Saccharopolyspora kobensis]SFD42182.1 protein of unknown function [Saccharopolyspora kobensis]
MTYPYDPNNSYYQTPQPYGMGGYPPMPRNNGMAIASMCVSLASIFTCYGALLIGPIGAILGHVSLREINRDPQAYTNRSMALTGIIVGWSLFAAWALLLTFVILAATGVLGADLQEGFDS